MVFGLVQYLVESNEYNLGDIAVLTPYNGQLAALTRKLSATCSLWLSTKDRESLLDEGLINDKDAITGEKTNIDMSNMLRLATIDNFQGEEAKVVILSTVRSQRPGFLKSNNRTNVACSRARNGFFILGNSRLMTEVPMWRAIVQLLKEKARIGPSFQACCPRHPQQVFQVRQPHDFEQIPVCMVPCGFELPCGHFCPELCHALALHERMKCMHCGDERGVAPNNELSYEHSSAEVHPSYGQSSPEIYRSSGIEPAMGGPPENIDRLYAEFGRVSSGVVEQLYDVRRHLDSTLQAFRIAFKPGPLSGRANERLVRSRGNAVMDVQSKITDIEGKSLLRCSGYEAYPKREHVREKKRLLITSSCSTKAGGRGSASSHRHP